jgi:hypothetical protein
VSNVRPLIDELALPDSADDLPHESRCSRAGRPDRDHVGELAGATEPRACERPSKTAALMVAARIASSGIMPVFEHVGELLGIIAVDRYPESIIDRSFSCA